jgi:tetratricopeptide (TPR) repeat protein
VDRETRHQLKHDEFKDSLVVVEEFLKNHVKEVLNVTLIAVVVLGLGGGLKYYSDQQESNANADLGEALSTFRATVGQPTPGDNSPEGTTYPTAQEKYKTALQQFDAILDKYKMPPRPKAVEIARYQAGVCQSLLGDHNGAIQTLNAASESGDAGIASLAKFALAGEMASSGKSSDAIKIYQELADHPSLTVPKASSLLAMADAYRESNPAEARKIYDRVQKDYGSNTSVAQAVKQDIASLNP